MVRGHHQQWCERTEPKSDVNIPYWHLAHIDITPSNVRLWGGKADILNSLPYVC
jgi:hypothetical protein